MKNVYFVQAAKNAGDTTVYLPYASGCLIAYAMQDEEIAAHYRFHDIVFMRENVDKVLCTFHEPFLVAFSCCLWNFEYSKILAQKVKEAFPSCYIIFGGHNVSNNTELLEKYSFIDFSIYGEGEHAFTALLKSLLHNTGFTDIHNLAYRADDGILINEALFNFKIENYPSPYLSGIFDDFFEKYPAVQFHAIIETNRGCPYNCAFCEWCFTKQIRFFPLEKVKQEIRWMSDKHIEYCYCADANFGITPRDMEIAEYVVSVRKENGYPKIFRPTYAKNSNEAVFEAGKILNLNSADKGVTIAYQSLNEDTLEQIGRQELNIHRFSELESKYSSEGIPTYTELILGLPGETYESFCNGLCRLLEAGQHNSVAVYQCQIYPNSLMGSLEYQQKFGIKTAKVPINGAHYILDFNGIPEYYDVVIGTAAMDTDEWLKANMFSVVLQAFHNMGLLRCFAIYLHYENKISYYTFYNLLLSYIVNSDGTYLQKLFLDFENRFKDTKTGDWTYVNEKYGRIGWYFDEAAFMELVSSWDVFWKEILPFFDQFSINSNLFQELLKYQKFIIRRPDIVTAYADFSYDFFHYFDRIYCGDFGELSQQKSRLTVATKIQCSSWEEYAIKIVLAGKRRGDTLYANEKDSVTFQSINNADIK